MLCWLFPPNVAGFPHRNIDKGLLFDELARSSARLGASTLLPAQLSGRILSL